MIDCSIDQQLDQASEDTHRRKALRLHSVRQKVRVRLQPETTHLSPRQRCKSPFNLYLIQWLGAN